VSRHTFAEHVGEVEIVLEAESEADLLREALAAFRELLGGCGDGEPASQAVELPPGTPPELLWGWLDELMYLAEVEDFIPERATVIDFAHGGLRAIVRGVCGRPRHLVKAVTLHDLAAATEGGIWHGRVVLDV
jgi:SHS2 domain-containing protein